VTDLDVVWGGINLNAGSGFNVESVTGWDDLPEITSYDQPRARGHGDHVGDQFARSRIVTASGSILSSAARDALSLSLLAASTVTSDVADLTITTFGRTLSAGARLIQRSLPIVAGYGSGYAPFALQWKCPDPLRYGPAQPPVSTGLPTSSGGVVYPLVYPLTYGTAGSPGRMTLTNNGTAAASIVAQITGGLPSGFEISTSDGQRIRYEFAVSAGETLDLDTGEGTLITGGTADRRGYLTVSDWIQVPPLSSLTLQFTSLGGAYDPAATLTVPAFRSASW